MRIEVTEETGIRHEGLGHMLQGEIRIVDDDLGKFFVLNGWAKDVDGEVEQGPRAELDFENPARWGKAPEPESQIEAGEGGEEEPEPAPKRGHIQPRNLRHKKKVK